MDSDLTLASRVSWQAVRHVFFQCPKVDIRPVVLPHKFPDEAPSVKSARKKWIASDNRTIGEMNIGEPK